jgi:hypothetical protein
MKGMKQGERKDVQKRIAKDSKQTEQFMNRHEACKKNVRHRGMKNM